MQDSLNAMGSMLKQEMQKCQSLLLAKRTAEHDLKQALAAEQALRGELERERGGRAAAEAAVEQARCMCAEALRRAEQARWEAGQEARRAGAACADVAHLHHVLRGVKEDGRAALQVRQRCPPALFLGGGASAPSPPQPRQQSLRVEDDQQPGRQWRLNRPGQSRPAARVAPTRRDA